MFLLVVSSNIIRGITAYRTYNFTYGIEAKLGIKLMSFYLSKDYKEIVQNNTTVFTKNILSETGQVVKGIFLATLQLAAQFFLVLGLISLLLLLDWQTTLLVVGVFAAVILVLYAFTKPIMTAASIRRVNANASRYKIVDEAFSGLKTIKISSLEKIYVSRFEQPAHRYGVEQTITATLSVLPKFILETVSFAGILLLLFFFITSKGGLLNALPLIALYAFAVYRLLPAVQQIYHSISMINAAQASLETIQNDLLSGPNENESKRTSGKFSFQNCLELVNVSFSYNKGVAERTLKDISLKIERNKIIGFAGKTGSGKTTTADILLGIL